MFQCSGSKGILKYLKFKRSKECEIYRFPDTFGPVGLFCHHILGIVVDDVRREPGHVKVKHENYSCKSDSDSEESAVSLLISYY